ncbi:hypothetical protein [Coprobacter secundus]|uniref:Lipoprotein n=1 Tax=Coprobacter secundus subsp. similis TaxID=2751153 RepID=A0A7G1HUJ0_9BACT|nr:hypothetical protein [Coprobacter secundus]BCI62084.1 hypothetical protein Cop2CBH44_04370 [Coprobacter secundus subsp. similis]
MKKWVYAISVVAIIISCTGKNNKAKEQYEKAELLFEQGEYNRAKEVIDSIEILYPNSFDEIKRGMQLMRKINLKEYERNLAYADSMLQVRKADVERLKKEFYLEKDAKYQEEGNYIYKTEKNAGVIKRSYVRAQVSEQGQMMISSVYFGPSGLKHQSMRVEAPDGTYALTAVIPYDGARNFSFTNDGNTTEVVTYKGPQMMSVANFIYNTPGKIKVSYEGKRPYSFYLDERSRKMLNTSYELASAMRAVKDFTREQAIASKTVEVLRRQIAEKEAELKK